MTDQPGSAFPQAQRELVQAGSTELSGQLGWLRDAPLFIDRLAIDAIYDAVVRPTYHDGAVTVSVTEAEKKALEGKLGINFKAMLASLLPIKAEAGANVEAKIGSEESDSKTQQVTFHPIKTAPRQLEQLSIFYLLNHQHRIEFVENLSDEKWRGAEWIKNSPRGIAFVDLAPGVILIPTAAEFANNKVVTLFDKMLAPNGERPPAYPEPKTGEDKGAGRREYWAWFQKNFSSTRAMSIIEEAASENGRIRWIDFRLSVADSGDTVHLHICPQTEFDTGALAYNFVKRGFKHGLRLIGLMKQEPDMNVLAVYEK